jgi:hypothetical protein
MMDIVVTLRDRYRLDPTVQQVADEIERLWDVLEFIYEARQSALQSLLSAENEIERLREALRYYACDCKMGCRDDRMNKCGYEATEALREKE